MRDSDVMKLRSDRLRFREMVDQDIDSMAALLGDPQVMRVYPRPQTRDEARACATSGTER